MKKKIEKLFSHLKKDKSLRVKNSYYTFSKEYPAGNIPIKRKMNKRLHSRFLKVLLSCLMFAVLCCAGFFVVSVFLEISDKAPLPVTDSAVTQSESLLKSDGVRALYMPYEHLGDSGYIRSFIKELRRKNCNSVVIQFKTPEGKLNYSSMLENAIKGKCSVFYNDTIRSAVDLFSQKNISVIAQLYCFEDPAVAESSPELAVKYMDTDINWLDGSDENGGKAWLSPTLKRNQTYIIGIINELYNLNIKGFILESCSYPDSQNTATATYPGEKNFSTKNEALTSFFKKIQDALPEDAFVLMSFTATDAVNGNPDLFDGDITAAAYEGYAVDLSVREEGYTVDKKSKFASMLSLFSLITKNYPDKAFVPVISTDEYSAKYISAIRKSGYTNFIIYDENGEY